MSTDFEEKERALISGILRNVRAQHARLTSKKLTAFASMKGERFAGELVVVGRAVNGWGPCFTLSELLEDGALNRIVEKIVQSSRDRGEKNECPMLWVGNDWVNRGNKGEYYASRSAFWRVTRAVADALGVADVNEPSWPTYLAWSNLYRVAPFCGGQSLSIPVPSTGSRLHRSPRSGDCGMEA